MRKELFDDFQGISLEQWKQKVVQDLKGKDYEETLVVNDQIEGITYDPLFHKDLKIKTQETPINAAKADHSYENIVQIDASVKNANHLVLDALMNGADGIWFKNIPSGSLDSLFKEVLFDCIVAVFDVNDTNTAIEINKHVAKYKDAARITVNSTNAKEVLPCFDGISNVTALVNGLSHNNSGANISQEIAFACSEAIELIYQTDAKYNVGFILGSGSNYFYEIAKYRAFSILWKNILRHMNIKQDTFIIGATGRINMAKQDHYTNLLRQTTQCMSAVLGGANAVTVEPYDFMSNESNERIARMAKNIPLILKEESYLDKIIDPSNGSYYLEWLTNEWLNKSSEILKKIEGLGGYSSAQDYVNTEVEKVKAIRKELFANNKIELIGVNLYPNENLEPLESNQDYYSYENTLK